MSTPKIIKQPSELQDYDFDFTDYLAGFDPIDDPAVDVEPVVTVDPGLELVSHSLYEATVKVWVRGGEPNKSYKISVNLTTEAGRVKQAEALIKVKEL